VEKLQTEWERRRTELPLAPLVRPTEQERQQQRAAEQARREQRAAQQERWQSTLPQRLPELEKQRAWAAEKERQRQRELTGGGDRPLAPATEAERAKLEHQKWLAEQRQYRKWEKEYERQQQAEQRERERREAVEEKERRRSESSFWRQLDRGVPLWDIWKQRRERAQER
jgi:hypothetical protein